MTPQGKGHGEEHVLGSKSIWVILLREAGEENARPGPWVADGRAVPPD